LQLALLALPGATLLALCCGRCAAALSRRRRAADALLLALRRWSCDTWRLLFQHLQGPYKFYLVSGLWRGWLP